MKERAEAERAAREAEEAKEREALEKAAKEKEEAARKAAEEKAALERAAQEKAQAEKAAKEAAERAAKEKAAAEKAAQEKAAQERARANQNKQGQNNASGKNGQNKDNRKGGKFVRPDGQNAQRTQNDGQKKTGEGGFWKTPSQEKTPGPVKRTLHTLDSMEPVKKVAVLGKVDLNAVKKQEEKAQSAGKKGIFANRSGRVYFVDNAQGGGKPQGGRPGNREGGFRPGNNAGTFNKDADSPVQGRRPQGAGQRRPAQGAQGAASGAAFGKPDQRGRKGTPNKRDGRDNFDRGGKRAENFHNLAKDQAKKNTREVEVEEQIKQITLPDSITIRELAEKMKIKATEIIKKLFLAGKMFSVNDEISYEEAENIAIEYDILCEHEEQVDVIEELLKEADEDEKNLEKRPPVVCVMGHVDHGKTSLLDAIRHTNVISREAGGITQHIGAYMVEINGEKITFLDTPGHEAFTAMRMRGAQATDIAILVVAADDGVMPQTVEAINHAKAANVDIIVAVNKIDKPAANVDRVKQELAEYGLIPEDWGGSTVFVPVSAKKNENIDQLLEMILLVTEVKELKANPNRELRGLVIEAKLDKGRGPVATVLVQKGTLKQGDFISAGACYGRVRAMLDADGNDVKKATPSTPVEVLGLNGVPMAGEVAVGHKNEKEARSFAETFIAEERKKMLQETKHKLTMDSLFEQIREGELKELPLIVKADVQGSVEALCSSLEKLSNDEVTVRVIHAGVGAITESDVTLAAASNAIVIGFNTKPDQQGRMIAEQEKVDVRLYRVIYQAIDDVQAALLGMLAPVYEEKILGHAEIRAIFKASGIGSIAGSYVLDGTIERGSKARITRGKDQIFDGAIASLKRFKDDVKEVREGFECGIVFEKFNDLMEGDTVEVYKMVRVEQK
ncbi:MAG: translation initiation factor IF-2 [Lachnospiraceae bacterium]|nr:translation initiation factor IF-2 [Lachnospiraceae bacterium]